MVAKPRRSIRRSRRSYKTKKPKSLSSKVNKLAKQMRVMKRDTSSVVQKLIYGQSTTSNSVSGDYVVEYLTKMSTWNRLFGTAADDETGRSALLKSITIDNYISLQNFGVVYGSETATIKFTYFVVSLKDRGNALFNESTGDLNTLVNGQHYVKNGGQVLLNRQYFNIHAYKPFTLSNMGTAYSNTLYKLDKRFIVKLRPKKMITNPNGNWKALNCPQDPSQNYFQLLFNDNSLLDLAAPSWAVNNTISIQTV